MLLSCENTVPEEHADSTCAHAGATGACERVRDALSAWCASLLHARRVGKATGTALAVMCNSGCRAYRVQCNVCSGVALWRAVSRREALAAVTAGRAAASPSRGAAADGVARGQSVGKWLSSQAGLFHTCMQPTPPTCCPPPPPARASATAAPRRSQRCAAPPQTQRGWRTALGGARARARGRSNEISVGGKGLKFTKYGFTQYCTVA